MNANIYAKTKIPNSNIYVNGSKQKREKKSSLTESPEVWLTQNY